MMKIDYRDCMYTLKPCPFCGETPHVVMRRQSGWRDRWYVLCDYNDGGCGASGEWCHSEEEAVAAWNRRIKRAP